MGNLNIKSTHQRNEDRFAHSNREERVFTSQFNVSQFANNFSGRSSASVLSNQSVYSASRPWSRVSRRRWNETTLNNPTQSSKTAWPVSNKESVFLPEFSISTELLIEFEVKGTLAKGAFGEVHRVQKQTDNREYALKVLSKHRILSESAVKQVKEEAKIQAACGHHSFIAGFISRWQDKKNLYIVSEYIPGGELLALLDKCGKLPEELVKIFVAEIAIAIDFLHNAGVIYRDLKPENILLDSEYHIKLIDFGLSKWLSIGSRTNTLCGTLKYMAPEVLSRDPYGHAVDWWSLGVISCRMLTNDYPTPAVGADTTKDAPGSPLRSFRSSQLNQTPGALPDAAVSLSKQARGLLLRLLDKDPKCRLRNLRQLQQSAFFMGTDFENIKKRKVTPRSVFEKHFPADSQEDMDMSPTTFPEF